MEAKNMPYEIEIVGQTDVGKRRSLNEDSIAIKQPSIKQPWGLAVLADGVGGNKAGEVASAMATQELIAFDFYAQPTSDTITKDFDHLADQLKQTVKQANSAVFEASKAEPRYESMCTTLVALMLNEQHYCCINVGDSRAYLLRDQRLCQLTRDDSLVQDWVDKGLCTMEEAKHLPYSHVITKTIGSSADVNFTSIQDPVFPGDLFLLCSDGLSDMLSDEEIEQTLNEDFSQKIYPLNISTPKLIAQANAKGGLDNISVILAQVVADLPA